MACQAERIVFVTVFFVDIPNIILCVLLLLRQRIIQHSEVRFGPVINILIVKAFTSAKTDNSIAIPCIDHAPIETGGIVIITPVYDLPVSGIYCAVIFHQFLKIVGCFQLRSGFSFEIRRYIPFAGILVIYSVFFPNAVDQISYGDVRVRTVTGVQISDLRSDHHIQIGHYVLAHLTFPLFFFQFRRWNYILT